MKANELRVGNWIHTNKFEQVIDVMCDSINTAEKEGVPYEDIAPIPLTEEWLEKLGYLRLNDTFYHPKFDWEISIRKNKWICHHEKTHAFYGFEVQHVHELQNAVFTFTGQELTIKNT